MNTPWLYHTTDDWQIHFLAHLQPGSVKKRTLISNYSGNYSILIKHDQNNCKSLISANLSSIFIWQKWRKSYYILAWWYGIFPNWLGKDNWIELLEGVKNWGKKRLFSFEQHFLSRRINLYLAHFALQALLMFLMKN